MSNFQLAYIAYPIDAVATIDDGTRQWLNIIEMFKIEMLNSGIAAAVYDPGDAFMVGGGEPNATIRTINDEALYNADLVVAFLPEGVPSIGVPMEIQTAAEQGKTVVVFGGQKSWSLAGMDGVVVAPPTPEGRDNALRHLRDAESAGGGPGTLAPLPVQRTAMGGDLPTRTYPDDAGLDLVVSSEKEVPPGGFVDVPCAIAMELPPTTWGLLIGRSSTLRKKQLLVNPSVIDAGYRGELFVGVQNMSNGTIRIEKGSRIAQIILVPNVTMMYEPIAVDELSSHPRGAKGFGSTGV